MTDELQALLRASGKRDLSDPRHAARRLGARAERDGGADVAYSTIDSPLGSLFAAATPAGLVRLAYDANETDALLENLAARVSPRIVAATTRLDPVRRELEEYFAGKRRRFDIALDWSLVRGDFGRRVLEVTSQIPFGSMLSYADVAERALSPRAVRAAGNALGANPLPIVVPCHRVMRSGGGLGGYTGGLEKKELLLAIEGVSL